MQYRIRQIWFEGKATRTLFRSLVGGSTCPKVQPPLHPHIIYFECDLFSDFIAFSSISDFIAAIHLHSTKTLTEPF